MKHVPGPVLPSKAEVESHNVSRLPFRSWCSACVRGRGFSLRHRKVHTKTKEAEQMPTVSVDCGVFGALPVLIVLDRQSEGIWSHQVPSKGVTHPYPARAGFHVIPATVQRRSLTVSMRTLPCWCLRMA